MKQKADGNYKVEKEVLNTKSKLIFKLSESVE